MTESPARNSGSRGAAVQEGGRWADEPTIDEANYLPGTMTRHRMRLRYPAWNAVKRRLGDLQCTLRNVRCASTNSWS